MELQHLKDTISNIEYESLKKINELKRQFIIDNNPFKKGDIILSSNGTRIKIEIIQYLLDMTVFGKPIAAFTGFEYTKQNKQKKYGQPVCVYQFNSNGEQVIKVG